MKKYIAPTVRFQVLSTTDLITASTGYGDVKSMADLNFIESDITLNY